MRSAWVHLHSGQASSLRPCLCEDGATPEGHTRSPGGRRGGGGSDRKGDVFFAGVLFLQFGEETRRVHITHEVSSLDTLHALIAHMFPQKLTMGMLKSPNTAILIKDEARNVFYELEDVRWAWARGRWEGSPLSPAPGCARDSQDPVPAWLGSPRPPSPSSPASSHPVRLPCRGASGQGSGCCVSDTEGRTWEGEWGLRVAPATSLLWAATSPPPPVPQTA